MTDAPKNCPWGCKAKHGLTKGTRDMHGDLNQNYAIWCEHARITAADRERATEIWNARADLPPAPGAQPEPEQPRVKEAAHFDIHRHLKDALFDVLEKTNLPENSAYGGVAIGGGEYVWLELRVEKKGYEPCALRALSEDKS